MRAKSAKTRRFLIIAAAIVAAAIAIRASLPWAVARYVNDRVEKMGEYRGHVADVDLSLVRGAYVLRDVTVVKPAANAEQPFLVLPRMDISIEWDALFDGALVSELEMHSPVINMVQGETPEETQLGTGVNWPVQVRELFPFRFNRAKITGGTLTFRAPGIATEESLTLRNLHVILRNLTNVEKREEPTFAQFEADGSFGENAPLVISGHIDPNEEKPTFDINMALEGARLVDANPWLEKFLNVDAEQGEFFMYAELASANGRFEGYIKPILENAEIFRIDEPASNPLRKAWEALVELVGNILENPEEDQIATRIPFSGELEDPEAGILATAVNLLRNAFVAAFTRSLEGSVTIEDADDGETE